MNDGNHSPNVTCSQLLCEYNFVLKSAITYTYSETRDSLTHSLRVAGLNNGIGINTDKSCSTDQI
jgi:hypothetical protein